jgi:hypothetical protein
MKNLTKLTMQYVIGFIILCSLLAASVMSVYGVYNQHRRQKLLESLIIIPFMPEITLVVGDSNTAYLRQGIIPTHIDRLAVGGVTEAELETLIAAWPKHRYVRIIMIYGMAETARGKSERVVTAQQRRLAKKVEAKFGVPVEIVPIDLQKAVLRNPAWHVQDDQWHFNDAGYRVLFHEAFAKKL